MLAQEVAERTWEAVQRARAEQALREREELLRFSMRGAGAGAWQWDVLAKGLIWSPECYGLHGLDPRLGKPGYEDWLRCVHPDDRESVEKAVFDALMRGSREYRTEYRVVLPSGEVRWLEGRGKVDYAAGGTPVHMAGIILDITGRKRAEEALREKEEWLRLAVKSSGAAAWQWDILKDEQVWSPESYKLHWCDPKLGPRVGSIACAPMIAPVPKRRSSMPLRRGRLNTEWSIGSCFHQGRCAGSMRWARWTTLRTARLCVCRASTSTSRNASGPRRRCARAKNGFAWH